MTRSAALLGLTALFIAAQCFTNVVGTSPSVEGKWQYSATGPQPSAASSAIPLLTPALLNVTLITGGKEVEVWLQWIDSSKVPIVTTQVKAAVDGTALSDPVTTRDWPFNVFLGVEYDISPETGSCTTNIMKATTASLAISRTVGMVTQQQGGAVRGDLMAKEVHSLEVVDGYLRYTITSALPALNVTFWYTSVPASPAPARPASAPSSAGSNQASDKKDTSSTVMPEAAQASPPYNYAVADSWVLTEEGLQENAMVIGLQGLANRDSAVLYLTYPEDWAYTYTPMVRQYYSTSRNLTFTTLSSAQQVLATLGHLAKGYVVWDTQVRESLVVAYTAAGVLDAVVVSAAQVPAVQAMGLPMLANFTGIFRGLTPIAIYTIAMEKYWSACNKQLIIWAGGVCGTQIQPGIMDYGVANRAFFTDLNTVPGTQGYPLADTLLGDMAAANAKNSSLPPILVSGWHSYCKDFEHTFTTLASKHGGRVHGLNTNPNLSFSHQIKLPAGYVFRNRPQPPPPPPPAQQSKVYLTLVQTDGLGLGAWVKPGRGTIDYSWEVTLPDLEIQPALLQMFYEQATDKDYFVAALSGPGYMYPKAVPPELLPARLQLAQSMMETLDLRHMVVFDASACVGDHTVTGDTWLTPRVVSSYFENMPATTGFMNGYGPTFTFQHDNSTSHSLVSFDYYLDPSRTVAQAVADLQTLAAVNPIRPYYLTVHVREFSAIGKVEQIIDQLDPADFEVVPVDTFFAMANGNPTWWNHNS